MVADSHATSKAVPAIPSLAEIKEEAAQVAAALQQHAGGGAANPGGGSKHRALPEDLRDRFVRVRAALFHRGVYDPVLVRFDTATAPQASTGEIAQQLATVAESL